MQIRIKIPSKGKFCREIFKTKFNISFGSTKSDACNRCNLLLTSLKTEIDEQKRMERTVQLELQQHKAKFGYNNNLKSEKELATQDPTISLISFDLQQVLPTPYLSTNVVVYKRQLSVYNLGVDEVATGKSFLHMWPETDTGRGSEDVAASVISHQFIVDFTICLHPKKLKPSSVVMKQLPREVNVVYIKLLCNNFCSQV